MKAEAKTNLDQRAWDDMVETYLPLVRSVAEKVHRRLPPGVDLTSLIHSGIVGLLEALGRFDPERGVAFEVYARYRIEGEVMQCLRSLDWASRSVRAWGRKVEAARSRLAGQLSRQPSVDEMAGELNVPLEEYYRIEQKVSEAALLSLEDLSITSEAQWEKAQEEFSNYPFRDPLTFVEDKDLLEKLTAAVQQLPERERLVVTLYYHEELTLREIGEIMSLTEGRVCQIFSQAVGRLKDLFGEKRAPKKKAAAGAAAKPPVKKDVA
ncbi:MAG TPA: FliA/WhiG family RNA polymerase sigma factor [Candidatus Binatia bacterium]|nr:FliA/WhiG family RNA polymerase sigma factor [Candidatus Binatia bacterium]